MAMAARRRSEIRVGETLAGKYRVERVLGRGGMGMIVAARHLRGIGRIDSVFGRRAVAAREQGRCDEQRASCGDGFQRDRCGG